MSNRKILIRTLFSILLILQTVLASNIVEYIGDDDNKITVIYLKGKPYEMGYIQGSVLKEEITAFYDSVLKVIQETTNPVYLDLAYNLMEPYIPNAYIEEMAGLAAGAEIDIKKVHRFHAYPDISEMNCSFFAAWSNATIDSNLYQIRALDYGTHFHLQEYPAIIVCDPDSGQRFVNVGWIGFIGIVSGMNFDGITISEIGESFDHENHTYLAEPMPFVLRDVLQYSKTIDHGIEIITNADRTSSYLYCVGDAKIPEARSLKTSPTICEIYSDETSPNDFLADVVYFSMGVSSLANLGIFNYLSPRHGSINPEIGKSLMRDLETGSLHSIVYDPTRLKLWVANAGIDKTPAFARTFVEFDLSLADSIFENYATTEIIRKSQKSPGNFMLYQNYPNPFNPKTVISLQLAVGSNVELSIYNILGQKIETLVNKHLSAGYHEVKFNGQNLSSGIYLYKIEAGEWSDVKKMILLR